MSTFFTKSEARAAGRNAYNYRTASQILQASVESVRDYETFDVFLSHSSRDAELILGVKTLLEQRSLTVYVDWINDAQLDRTRVTPQTADVLRKRMRQCQSLIYAATDNASGSKWMPWELGYFDGLRNQNVAILPLTDTPYESFKGQEYLGLYPVVSRDTGQFGVTDVFVDDHNRRRTLLREFAKGRPSWSTYR